MSQYIGISLNDDFTELAVGQEGHELSLPTIICKKKNNKSWTLGEDAYKLALDGSGIMVDKLLSLLRKGGTATIDKVCHSAAELMEKYLELLLSEAEKLYVPERDAEENPECRGRVIVLSLRNAEPELFRELKRLLERAADRDDRVLVISHTESFVHYMLRQDKNLYNRPVGMFELSNQCLYYYELQVSRGSRRYVVADSEAQEEAFSLDILKTPSGCKIADRILCSLADRNLGRKSFSSIFLSGRGFESTEFAPGFMQKILKGRRACIEPKLFALGAMHYAAMIFRNEQEEYTILCDTRAGVDVSVMVIQREREMRLPIIHAGDNWANHTSDYEMILDRQNYVDFQLNPLMGGKRGAQLRMPLEGFPERENRTTRIGVHTEFLDRERLRVTVRDLGFGELFPPTEAAVTEEISLRRVMEES